ncbi:efflux transporter outer membrane subunit [Stenotrophomonas sp. CFBP 13718]|uniref:efflux transporter outer membrane subunit n=1 Tax=Stenotrophomonas sp. CFBP 13718 TaxID=2775304 RepID=UPI0017875925|nr:efflux transporter outer membrane subunit [Stenotrophomonas sp. CFBP 13718]MBD8695151.1 efflux transporter outer membrane subunit [Stenotrophomonas sp. CFBP 13718]
MTPLNSFQPAARLRPLSFALLPLLLAGCMLGPDYTRPDVARPATAQAALPRADQAGVVAAAPPSQWWRELRDPLLDELVDEALRNSPNLRAAQAKVVASRALQRQRRAEQLPSVGAAAGYANVQAPDSLNDSVRGLGENVAQVAEANGRPQEAAQLRQQFADVDLDTELYVVGFDASWELDLFGRRRRAAEQAAAEAGADAAALADAQVQLAAELTQVYLSYRSSQQRIALAEDNLRAADEALRLSRQRRERGADSDLQVERAQAQREQPQARIPPLRAQADEARDVLALMVGREPGALDGRLGQGAELPALPARIAVDDAAALIRRRPDIRKAERELAASSAQIGQALTAYFPQVTLLGTVGAGAGSLSDLGSDSAATIVAPFLRWSVFDFGRNKARVAQARAGNEARMAAYEGTVLAALQDANTALARFGAARQQVQATTRAEASATRADRLMQQRRQAGAASQIDLLDVQRQQLDAQDGLAQAQLQLLVRYVALQKSLGLGWQEAPEAAVSR